MEFNILIVEDEKRIREFIKAYFEKEGWNIFEAENGDKALNIFNKEKIDLVILDIMLPGIDGKYVCSKLRENSEVIIIMLTALENEELQLKCFEIGADDYITKPFLAKILVAKVKRFLDKLNEEKKYEIYEYKELKINFLTRDIYIRDKNIKFSPKEFNLLIYLIKSNGAVKTRDQILDEIWGYDYYGHTRVVDNHILKIRNKLKNCGGLITTVVGMGYKYEGN